MPPRLARASINRSSSQKTTNKKPLRRKNRNLNAFSIASSTHPEHNKVRQHRLGETELDADEPRRKKQRLDDDDSDSEDGAPSSNAKRLEQKNVRKHDFDDIDANSGNDSEGNRWHVGFNRGGEDEDEELDSDEAFGESDEERFADYVLRGSKTNKPGRRRAQPKVRRSGHELSLDENEHDSGDENDDDSDDSLGSDAVDLATMLDQQGEEEDGEDHGHSRNARNASTKRIPTNDDFGGWSDDGSSVGSINGKHKMADSESEQYDEESLSSCSEADDGGREAEKLGQLRGLVDSLSKPEYDDDDSDEVELKPGALTAALRQVSGEDLQSTKQKRKASKGSKQPGSEVLQVPLPKRQQDGVNRRVAYKAAKDTLDRWQDTVKHNRRADHLMFPLTDPSAQEAQGSIRLMPASTEDPRNDLENAIEGILQQSGLSRHDSEAANANREEHNDELPTNKVSLKDVLERRAEMRRARDLLFREEQRSKRIKKIKSKAYRRVHRKERERNAQKERDLMTAAGIEPSEDERERNDRRRAEERMGARHRESRWAKGVKQSGRAAWDEEARSGVTEMARRNEELRQRIQGKTTQGEEDNMSSTSDQFGEDDDLPDDEAGVTDRLCRQLDGVESADGNDQGNDQQSRLGSLGFMQRADARRKQQNDAAIKDLRRDLADGQGEFDDDAEETSLGRRTFGPTASDDVSRKTKTKPQNELEEGQLSGSEGDANELAHVDEALLTTMNGTLDPKLIPNTGPVAATGQSNGLKRTRNGALKSAFTSTVGAPDSSAKAVSAKGKSTKAASSQVAVSNDSKATISAPASNASQMKSSSTNDAKDVNSSDNDDDDAEGLERSIALNPSNEELVRAAFGIDEAATTDFAQEKQSAAVDEDDKIIDKGLPGWGSWAGAGITKRQKAAAKQHAKRFQTGEEGVKAVNRKDAKLQNAIISEKRVRKNAKYLAPMLPHPFESKQQYERSLRLPIGPEWTTKESFQSATKPRVLLKQGVIQPMAAPLV